MVIILLAFNHQDKYVLSELADKTGIQEGIKSYVLGLCNPKNPVLLKSSKGPNIDLKDIIEVNTKFKNAKTLLRIDPYLQKNEASILNPQDTYSDFDEEQIFKER